MQSRPTAAEYCGNGGNRFLLPENARAERFLQRQIFLIGIRIGCHGNSGSALCRGQDILRDYGRQRWNHGGFYGGGRTLHRHLCCLQIP